jgi:hypothetical protein
MVGQHLRELQVNGKVFIHKGMGTMWKNIQKRVTKMMSE